MPQVLGLEVSPNLTKEPSFAHVEPHCLVWDYTGCRAPGEQEAVGGLLGPWRAGGSQEACWAPEEQEAVRGATGTSRSSWAQLHMGVQVLLLSLHLSFFLRQGLPL